MKKIADLHERNVSILKENKTLQEEMKVAKTTQLSYEENKKNLEDRVIRYGKMIRIMSQSQEV